MFLVQKEFVFGSEKFFRAERISFGQYEIL
jgi:hypothetical protein